MKKETLICKFNFEKTGLTLIEVLVICAIFGLLSVGIFNFFMNVINVSKKAESQTFVFQNQNFILENLPVSLKNCIPVKIDGFADTTAFFGSLPDKYLDFYNKPSSKFISDLETAAGSLSQSSFIRYVSLSPTITDTEQSTIYNFSFGVGTDKYLSESTNPDIMEDRKKFRLFRSCISKSLDDRLNPADSLNADSFPFYLKDYCSNITGLSFNFFDPVTLTWVSGSWDKTYLPAAVEIKVTASDDIKKIGDSKIIGSGLSKSVIVSLPCSNLE